MISELFGDVDRFVNVNLMGQPIEVPDDNTLLRGFQYNSPDTISVGRFCWNGSCMNCTVTVNDGDGEHKHRACRTNVHDGMKVISVSPELKRHLGKVIRPN